MVQQAHSGLKMSGPKSMELRSYLRPEAILKETTTEGGPSSGQIHATYRSLKRRLAQFEKETNDRAAKDF